MFAKKRNVSAVQSRPSTSRRNGAKGGAQGTGGEGVAEATWPIRSSLPQVGHGWSVLRLSGVTVRVYGFRVKV